MYCGLEYCGGDSVLLLNMMMNLFSGIIVPVTDYLLSSLRKFVRLEVKTYFYLGEEGVFFEINVISCNCD